MRITGEVDKNTKMFIPVNYDKGWKTIKGDTDIKQVYNTFIGIELKKGTNEIELEFKPKLYEFSVIVTILTIFFMIIAGIFSKKFDIRNINIIMSISWIIGILIYVVAVLRVYIVSIIQTMIFI